MWTETQESLNQNRVCRYQPLRHGQAVSFKEVIELWQRDEGFRLFFSRLLSDSAFAAFRWETPLVTSASANRDFEFVLVDTPQLERPVDVRAFSEHFGQGDSVATFANLSGDATMVVPCPLADAKSGCYGHLAAFVRNGPTEQVNDFWKAVGKAMESGLSQTPLWLSTAGMGVAWLHVRLDSRPKYYAHIPYKTEAIPAPDDRAARGKRRNEKRS